MKKEDFDSFSGIYLFKIDSPILTGSCLPIFMNYLKYNQGKGHYIKSGHFTYIPQKAEMINNLTIEENLLLNFEVPFHQEEKSVAFKTFLQEHPNENLLHLYSLIDQVHFHPKDIDQELLKLAALFTIFITNRPFVFLEYPEAFLSEKTLQLFIHALKRECELKKISFFLVTNEEKAFQSLYYKNVFMEKNFTFSTGKISYQEDFEERKKAFYDADASAKKEIMSPLKFHLPKKKTA